MTLLPILLLDTDTVLTYCKLMLLIYNTVLISPLWLCFTNDRRLTPFHKKVTVSHLVKRWPCHYWHHNIPLEPFLCHTSQIHILTFTLYFCMPHFSTTLPPIRGLPGGLLLSYSFQIKCVPGRDQFSASRLYINHCNFPLQRTHKYWAARTSVRSS